MCPKSNNWHLYKRKERAIQVIQEEGHVSLEAKMKGCCYVKDCRYTVLTVHKRAGMTILIPDKIDFKT